MSPSITLYCLKISDQKYVENWNDQMIGSGNQTLCSSKLIKSDQLSVEWVLWWGWTRCSRVSCSSQTWSARWRWQWYWSFCDWDMVGCSKVDRCASSRI